MALEHAIMASLAERPGTGYEIGQQFTRSIGYFWSATHQQIYRTLKKLHTDGLVNYQVQHQDSRPDKKVYTLSPHGHDVLESWISEPAAIPRLRDDLSVKLRAAEHGDLRALLGEFTRHRDAHATQLKLYQSFARHYEPAPTSGRRLHQYLVLRGGIAGEHMFVTWCDDVVTALTAEIAQSHHASIREEQPV